ncbi:MAG: hypothetical protein LUM44_17800 [Pyrinomonadaceae bacterium]|nr:hypothetical protein [Pyrinomonadaceae bacterium]
MNCECGENLMNIDAFECERLKIHKTMCRTCRADFMEFHETEIDMDAVLRADRVRKVKRLAGVL